MVGCPILRRATTAGLGGTGSRLMTHSVCIQDLFLWCCLLFPCFGYTDGFLCTVFRYKKGTDSVLVVTKQDYDACNGGNPIQKLEGGDSEFKLDRSGPFFFISGTPGNCQKGQKLQVVVLAVRNEKPGPSPPAPPPAIPPSPLPPSERPTSPPAPPPSPSSNSSSGTGTETTPSPSPIPSHPSHSSSLAGASTITLGLAAMILGGAFVY